jgi:hypothetical protein
MCTALTRPRWLPLPVAVMLVACAGQPLPPGPGPTAQRPPLRPDYLTQLSFRPQEATYFDLLDRELGVAQVELALLARI